MRLGTAGILASLALAVPAMAQTAAQPAPEATEAKPAKPKKVCRSVQVTGQRIPKRECRTEAEWASVDSRDSTEALRVRTVGSAGNN